MKFLNYFNLSFLLFFPIILHAQAACESGSSQATCSANIPLDAIVVTGNQTFEDVSMSCYWVCPGDTLNLNNAQECSVFLEREARLTINGVTNFIWAKSEAKVEIVNGSVNTKLGILEDVIFIDDGTNTDETICDNVSFDYSFAPLDGCDLTIDVLDIEMTSIDVFPNPVNGKTMLSLSMAEGFYGEFYLSDSFGRTVKKWKSEGQSTLHLPLDNTAPGVYFIHVPNASFVEKIVIY